MPTLKPNYQVEADASLTDLIKEFSRRMVEQRGDALERICAQLVENGEDLNDYYIACYPDGSKQIKRQDEV